LKNWEREKPVAVLSIIGETKTYFPNETIKTQLKSGLLELMNTTNIWIITEGQDTCIGQIVEEVIRENTDKSQSCCCHKDDIHLARPLIVMLVGGEEGSFEAALVNLKRSVPILVIDGSGKAADFICKGSRMGMNISSAEFQSELIHAAKMLYGSNDEKTNTIQTKCEKLIKQLQNEIAEHSKSIHVYSVYETTYTLDKTIQDILFDVFYLDEQNEDKLTDNILHFVDLWNRPDIAEKKIFKLENSRVLEELQKELGKKESTLSKLFTNALKDDRIDMITPLKAYIRLRIR
ncbi:hypothetical protein AM593_00734, partial [Mytilus galloprovincialis]